MGIKVSSFVALALCDGSISSITHRWVKRELPWSVPLGEKIKPGGNVIRLAWSNEDEIVALRSGGLLGCYDCSKKTKLWEKQVKRPKGMAVGDGKVYVTSEEAKGGLLVFDVKDGSEFRSWDIDELKELAEVDFQLKGPVMWLPETKMLAVESSDRDAAKLWFFDPAKAEFKGSAPLGMRWSNVRGAVAGRYFSLDDDGVVRSIDSLTCRVEKVWESGLWVTADDVPRMLAYQPLMGGGFIAVTDRGAWESGSVIVYREGPDGEEKEAIMTRSLEGLAIDAERGRIWAKSRKHGWFGVLGLAGKPIAEGKGLPFLSRGCSMAISPGGGRAVLVDSEEGLIFVTFPEAAKL